MLLMWAPGLGELLVIAIIVAVVVVPLMLLLGLLLRLLSGKSRGGVDKTAVRDLQQKIAQLERRIDEKE